jgi:hypothetical protein
MDLLLNCTYGFKQQYARSIVKIAFKVSKTKFIFQCPHYSNVFFGLRGILDRELFKIQD